METPEYNDRSLPSPWNPGTPPPAVPAKPGAWGEDLPDLDPPPSRAFSPKTVLRALRRHWWQILLIWGVGSAALMALAYYKIKPRYDAIAWLKVEPNSKFALVSGLSNSSNLNEFMKTQVRLITSPDVLKAALVDDNVRNIPRIRAAADAEEELRDGLAVSIPPETNLILISMSSNNPKEAQEIVRAVTEAYLKKSGEWVDVETKKQIDQLTDLKKQYESDKERLRGLLRELADAGTSTDPGDSNQVALDQYRLFRTRLSQVDLDLIDAHATLRVLQDTGAQDAAEAGKAPETPNPEPELTRELHAQLVAEAFASDPAVAQLDQEIAATTDRLNDARRRSRNPSEAAVAKFGAELKKLKFQRSDLWRKMQPRLAARIADSFEDSEKAEIQQDPAKFALANAEIRLAKLTEEKRNLETQIDEIQINTQADNNDALMARFHNDDLVLATEMHRKVSNMLEQLEFEAHGPTKINMISEAKASMIPSSNNQARLMAVAPVGVLLAVLGLFVLVESRAGRVADPDDLTTRLRLGVLGVVPPLPSLRPPKGPKALRDQRRRVEEFVQSLDHLRVTLCSGRAGGHRCVMITSACGGEGKTTLAAQLAGRCANAGMSTLLVDADLRRPSLGELLEVPGGPGLAEVLLGEAEPDEAMVVVGNAGGFHLLPAGAVGHDPSRLLQGDRLGQLVARLREAFDIVLIDAPPVLAVPDALLVGRWTDGAIVAVRHDTSRFPMVERAQKRLSTVGVPVLGAVVNGARPPESSYGAYGYYLSTGAGGDYAAEA